MGALQLAAHRLSPACRGLSNRERVFCIMSQFGSVQFDRRVGIVEPTHRASTLLRKRKIAPPMIA
jgi:hypothetical protein